MHEKTVIVLVLILSLGLVGYSKKEVNVKVEEYKIEDLEKKMFLKR